MSLTLGSLFDGIGGFPLAGIMNGITPVWASEIEPFPLKVTAARFPEMKQLGDIRNIDGHKIQPVDIITFGSPCQDLSVAGRRDGLTDGTRSSLFFEAIRIIKEMRDSTGGKYPKYAVWENVCGTYSSNKGEDFRAVIQSFCEIKDPFVAVPRPKNGKWSHAGTVVGDGYSIAWRVYDAQYWGVPQRRKRIYLIADFTGERAGEILFKPESLRGDFTPSREAWQRVAVNIKGGAGRSGGFGIDQQGGKGAAAYAVNVGPTLCSDSHGTPHGIALKGNSIDLDTRQNGVGWLDGEMHTLDATDRHAVCIGNGQLHQMDLGNKTGALNCMHDQQAVITTAGCHERYACRYVNSDGSGIAATLDANYYRGPGARNGKEREFLAIENENPPRKYIVRRLTPTEVARLQGFPDEWCKGLGGSDSAIYKAYGNGLALPCAFDVLSRIVELEQEKLVE